MEALVLRVEAVRRVARRARRRGRDEALSPTTRLAAMLKEALAANTIGGKVDEESRVRAAQEDVRQAQASWSRIGAVPEPAAVRSPIGSSARAGWCSTGQADSPDQAAPGRPAPPAVRRSPVGLVALVVAGGAGRPEWHVAE